MNPTQQTEQHEVNFAALLHEAVTKPGTVATCYSNFHNYSIGNQLLAAMQCAGRQIPLGPINTYNGWKELGRHVQKGAKALELCMPITGKRTVTEKDEATGEERTKESGYTRFVYRRNWFVLSQTEGEEYKPEPIGTWSPEAALAALNIQRIPFDLPDGNCQGYAKARTIAISPIADHPERTMLHEMAHVILGHTTEHTQQDSGERTPRDIRELEAECTALLVSEALGLPGADEARGYVQSWYRGNEVPEKSARKIMQAADAILKAGRTSQEPAQ